MNQTCTGEVLYTTYTAYGCHTKMVLLVCQPDECKCNGYNILYIECPIKLK